MACNMVLVGFVDISFVTDFVANTEVILVFMGTHVLISQFLFPWI